MTIYQSSNTPLIITFPCDISGIKQLEISLYKVDTRETLKHWSLNDVEIDEDMIICPLLQSETAKFPVCNASLEMKWLDDYNYVKFSDPVDISIKFRQDKTIMRGN